MEDYSMNNHYDHYGDIITDFEKARFIEKVVTWIIISVGLPLNVAAIYTTRPLVRKDHVALIFVINLLISDIIQLCSMIGILTVDDHWWIHRFFWYVYVFGVMTSFGFMLCISLERYLVVTSPRCSCFRQAIKISEVVCLVVWAVPLLLVLRVHSFEHILGPNTEIVFLIFLLLPFPLLIFFLGGTLKGLSAASSVQPDEKRKIVGILVLMLLIYTLLFLPTIIFLLVRLHIFIYYPYYYFLLTVFLTIPRLSPLANVCVYVLLRKGAVDRLLACVCCCRMDNSEISSRVNDDTVITVSSV